MAMDSFVLEAVLFNQLELKQYAARLEARLDCEWPDK